MKAPLSVCAGDPDLLTLSEIKVDPKFNARTIYREIDTLAISIEENGLQQPLVVYYVGDVDGPFLQSGFRRHAALTKLAEKHGGDLEVPCIVMHYPSHDDAMLAALTVDATGDPLRNFDLAVRCDYLQRKFPKRQVARIVGIHHNTVATLIRCLRDLDPRVIDFWSKAPSPETEIPLAKLDRWRKASPSTQRVMLEAYRDGSKTVLGEDGEPLRVRGKRLDGRDRPTVPELRDEMRKVFDRIDEEKDPSVRCRYEGMVKSLRFALGEVSRVLP